MPLTEGGENRPGDLSLAARNALLATVDELRERGFSRQQAYALCSIAVDLKISQVVDVPNVLVSPFLPSTSSPRSDGQNPEAMGGQSDVTDSFRVHAGLTPPARGWATLRSGFP
jgi:Acetamidase/Formamidase family